MRASGEAFGSHAAGVTVETDVAVIGAGPVGLFAVFECGMLRMRCVVVDALDAIGGQCSALYPEKPIFDIPAHPQIEGAALIERLETQAAPFNPLYLLGRRVERLRGLDGTWELGTSAGDQIRARAVILAAGAGAFGPNRPPLDGLAGYEASGAVRYLVARREDFRGKRVVIAGGGDSAVDWALSLKEIAARVTVVHRRPKFRAAPESAARLDEAAARGEVEMAIPYQLHGLAGDGTRLSGVVLSTLKGETKTVEADHLLPFYGLSMELGPIADWGLGLERTHIAVTPATCETNLSGIHAIGDIATYPGKLKLILQGFSEAAMAAHAIHPRVFPGEALHFEYSTTKGVPAA
ncbi:NAD(P)/FAD-dependent oxidoreductase [Paracraurococcus ruber]|uniref:Ferredoxin--NADP reductase n=1 Tax=Paracraurococcus ruber TaxID=77675 RepID=A0ABS1D6K9_9PROT|nr:NAD(P)/FAD-dependent oxidoreductase [Paracraurococcus ruber]MBK1662133.1 ferredoxin--NADP(+) reductase [Paracraurococcus ruber]TDG16178.1 NAD(P)/FAD-dependent oxidoreductase [Paracraurococcus ruber]